MKLRVVVVRGQTPDSDYSAHQHCRVRVPQLFRLVSCAKSANWAGGYDSGKFVGQLTLATSGSCAVSVHPAHRRRGIATRLLTEAASRWEIDWAAQFYTVAGAEVVRRFLAARNIPAEIVRVEFRR